MPDSKCPYCGFQTDEEIMPPPENESCSDLGHHSQSTTPELFKPEHLQYAPLTNEVIQENRQNLTKLQKESYWRSKNFTSHNWTPRNPEDVLSIFCDDCGKTPVELGFWKCIDWSTLKTKKNAPRGWMQQCKGKVAKVIRFPKEENIERRQNNKSSRKR